MSHNRFSASLALPPTHMVQGGAVREMGEMRFPLPGAKAARELVQLVAPFSRTMLPPAADVQVKANGIRCLYIGGPHRLLVTREGHPIEAGRYCLETLQELEALFGRQMVFDGELAHAQGLNATLAALAGKRPDASLIAWLFDCLDLSDWLRGGGGQAMTRRHHTLLHQAERLPRRVNVGVLTSWPVSTYSEVRALYRAARTEGHEGVVVKDSNAPYARHRSPTWMKITAEEPGEMQS
jgi:ATP-dependent DNA ligase